MKSCVYLLAAALCAFAAAISACSPQADIDCVKIRVSDFKNIENSDDIIPVPPATSLSEHMLACRDGMDVLLKVLKSDFIIKKVKDKLGGDDIEKLFGGSFLSKKTPEELIAKNLIAEADGNEMTIGFRNPDKALSSKITGLFIEGFSKFVFEVKRQSAADALESHKGLLAKIRLEIEEIKKTYSSSSRSGDTSDMNERLKQKESLANTLEANVGRLEKLLVSMKAECFVACVKAE